MLIISNNIRKLIFVLSILLMSSLAHAEKATETAVFAGGCFWCVESNFEHVNGIIEAVSGYAGGNGANPTYHDYVVKNHIEVVKVTYDPSIISYDQVLESYWAQVDPTDGGGQFCDRGHAYSTAIFYANKEQEKIALASKKALSKSNRLKKPVTTALLPLTNFYPAEEYHQDYYKKNPLRYKIYRLNCGRDKRLNDIWGKDANHRISLKLSKH